jgi:acyl-CoA thioesterase I
MIRPLVLTVALVLALASCSGQEKREPPLTYVSLGDSLAVGAGASKPEERGYAPLLRDKLAEKTERKVRLVQLGVSGETSETFVGGYPDEESSQLARAEKALKNNPGAVVTLSLGGNDLLRTALGTDADRGRAIADYGRNLDHILETLREASDPAPEVAVLAIYNPAPGGFTDEWTGRLNDEIRAVADRNSVAVAAGDRAFRGHEEEYTRHARDDFDPHPTDAGYEALADAFADALEIPEDASSADR